MNWTTILRYLGAALLAGAALHLSILNWMTLIRGLTRPAPSWIPLLGGLLGAGAILLEPNGWLAGWWWAAFLADGGSAPGALYTLYFHLLRARHRS